ncbi:MAG TPA: S41 family peptidase [Candidatus Dojkabacteria bacterium]|jgi:carboxyl-terminal processing protease
MNDPQVKKYFKIMFAFVIGSLLFILGFVFGKVDFVNRDGSSNQFLYGDLSGDQAGVDAELLWEAWNKLETNYIEDDLDKQKLLYGAIDGIVRSLDDPYTSFLTPEDTNSYSESSGGQFEGIGAYLRFDGEYTIIDIPIADFPAEKAGLVAGDLIFEVDGQDVQGKDSYEVANIIRGPKGTEVSLKIFRPKDQKEYDFSVTRDVIDLDNIELKEVRGNTALLKLYKFNESDTSEFVKQWNEVVSEILEKDTENIIVDLRNNPGGRVDLVRYVTEEFLNNGDLIMIEEERNGDRIEYKAERDGRLRSKNIVVLVNEGSASASEIFAGAIQDNDRGEIIGMPTVGKGLEQRIIELSDGSTMHIVFRRWLTPDGKQVTKEDPIHPDTEVELTTEDFQSGLDPQLDRAWEFFAN